MRCKYIQNDILNYLSDFRKHTLQDIANEVNISTKTAQRHVADLAIHHPIQVYHGGREKGGVQLHKAYIVNNSYLNNEELQIIVKGLELLQQQGYDVEMLIEKMTPPERRREHER